jgi:hypothetical protein
VVDRRQRIRLAAVPAPSVASVWGEIVKSLKAMGSPTSNLPRRVTNRLVDFWVNRSGGLRRKRA